MSTRVACLIREIKGSNMFKTALKVF